MDQSGRGGRLGCFEEVEVKVRMDPAEDIEEEASEAVSSKGVMAPLSSPITLIFSDTLPDALSLRRRSADDILIAANGPTKADVEPLGESGVNASGV